MRNIPEYAGLSELAYILDKPNLLNLCEYFGGLTITIPKIEDLEILLYGLLIYQDTHVNKITLDEALKQLSDKTIDQKALRECYSKICTVVNDYEFSSRGN